MRLVRLLTILAVAPVGVLTTTAGASPDADDLSLRVQLARGFNGTQDTKTTGLNFRIAVVVDSSSGVPQTITMTIGLPAGLHWGNDGPDPSEGCDGTSPATCKQALQSNAAGTVGGGWIWDVVADQPGVYEVGASVEGEQVDPNPTNNATTFRFEVVQPSTGGSPGAGGGGSAGASVSASGVKLAPARPRAGSTVVASVRVTKGGSPVRPSAVACAATVGKTKLRGGPKSASGVASCLFKTPAGAKGKTFAGSLSFTAGGARFTKRFSARLR